MHSKEKHYHTSLEEAGPDCPTPMIQVFTDGSKHSQGTGCGALIQYKFAKETCKGKLPREASVFQGEVTAISLAAERLVNQRTSGCLIHFHSDSQAAIQALDNFETTSKTCQKAKGWLNSLGRRNDVHVQKREQWHGKEVGN